MPSASNDRFVRRHYGAESMIGVKTILARDVMEIILSMVAAKQKNELRIEAAQRKSIAVRIARVRHKGKEGDPPIIDDRRIRRALTELVEASMLERYGKGMYRIPPNSYYVGSTESRVVAIEDHISRKAQ